jgi:hypothetical protein
MKRNNRMNRLPRAGEEAEAAIATFRSAFDGEREARLLSAERAFAGLRG